MKIYRFNRCLGLKMITHNEMHALEKWFFEKMTKLKIL